MKVLIATAALATLIASPALAQNWQYGPSAYQAYGQYQGPGAAYAQQPYATYGGYGAYGSYGRVFRSWDSVYDSQGRYVGSDPDGKVRDQLARDPSQGD
jgi:hypothetical protein